MPAPAVTAALIAGGGNLVGQGIGAFSQASMNKKTRKWNEKMYGVQRRDALADWNMMNDYNSPMAQMARLKQAGLNPALVYKNGADNVAPAVRSTSVDSWNPQPIQFNPGASFQAGLSAFYDVEMKQAQVDNLHEQNKILQQESVNKSIDAILKTTNIERIKQLTESGRFYLGRDKSLLETTLEAARENLRKVQIGNQVTLAANERAALLTTQRLSEGVEKILLMRAQTGKIGVEKNYLRQVIENLKKDATMKQLDIDLMRLGINPRVDGIKERIAGRIISNFTPDAVREGANKVKEFFMPWTKPRKGSQLGSLPSPSWVPKRRK